MLQFNIERTSYSPDVQMSNDGSSSSSTDAASGVAFTLTQQHQHQHTFEHKSYVGSIRSHTGSPKPESGSHRASTSKICQDGVTKICDLPDFGHIYCQFYLSNVMGNMFWFLLSKTLPEN